jgi:hypothetical protein
MITMWALGNDHHRVLVEGEINFDEVIVGHDDADVLARALARRMGASTYGSEQLAHWVLGGSPRVSSDARGEPILSAATAAT